MPERGKGCGDSAVALDALRRAEVCSLDLEDYSSGDLKLLIKGKGKLTKESISLSSKAVVLINDWLGVIGERLPDKPLFCTVDRATFGHRLSGNAIYNIVRNSSESAGITKIMSPHRIRHSAITAALDATNGDTRKVQKLSRHKNLNTLMIYDDNRHQHQSEVTNILADLV